MPQRDLGACGADVTIYEWVRLTAPEQITIGSHVVVDDFVFLQGGSGLRIGDHVHIASFTSITGGGVGVIGDFANIGPGCRVLTGTDLVDGEGLLGPTVPDAMRAVRRARTALAEHAFLGANVVVLPGVTVGEGAVIGAHALVTRDVEPWTINVGAPARRVRERPRAPILELARRLRDGDFDRA